VRTSEGEEHCIPLKEIHGIASRLGIPYVETSAVTQKGVQNCFDTAVKLLVTL